MAPISHPPSSEEDALSDKNMMMMDFFKWARKGCPKKKANLANDINVEVLKKSRQSKTFRAKKKVHYPLKHAQTARPTRPSLN
jgi:hypothetical protein